MPNSRGDQDIDAQFEDLYRRYYRAVVSFLVRLGFPREQARDLAQDVFVRVYRSMDRYRGEAEWTYLETAARRVALNELRRRQTRGRSGVEVPLDAVVALANDPSLLPDDRLAEKEEKSALIDKLSTALEALPQGLRGCLQLRLQGLRYRQIAETMGISVDAVKSRLHEAKSWLRKRLGEEPTGLVETEGAEEDP